MMGDTDRFKGVGEEEQNSPTFSEYRRLRAELALQARLLTGRRESESLVIARDVLATFLGHGKAEMWKFYVGACGTCPTRGPTSCFEMSDALARAGRARGKPASVSPFGRVHEEMDREDALAAHLGALRGQLERDD